MRMPGTSWFWIAAIILAAGAICLTPVQAQVNWTYAYHDDFSTDKVEEDSYFHSIFWPQGAFPPRQAYLYFRDKAEQRELGFRDYYTQEAYLSYCFPVSGEKSPGAIEGNLHIDVRLPYGSDVASSLSGYLLYSFSADGINWSAAQELEPGSHDIPIESVRGSCYVIFSGTGVLIDNLEVNLYSPSATILVPGDYTTIQDAIDNASDGDIVEVASDTYSGDGNRDIDFRGKAITVRSSDGPDETIIDCTGSEGHRGFYFHGGEGPDSVLRGFTIVGATVPGSDVPLDSGSWMSSPVNPVGGGIYCEFSSPSIVDCVIKECATELGGGIGVVSGSPTIIDCVIEDCRAGGVGRAESGGRGAGIGLIRGSDVTILHSQIKDNSGYYNSLGAGVYCWRSRAFFANCDISYNTAQGNVQGGGAYCGGTSARIEFENCVISNNTAEIGGGLYADPSDDNGFENVIITNCTVAHNSLSGDQPADSTGGGIHSVSSNIAIRNSIVWYNDGVPILLVDPASISPVLYSCIEGGYPGQGNIDSDPLFAGSPWGNDYHLKSVFGHYEPWGNRWVNDSEYSPCIDAGDPQDPVGAEPLTNGKRINMGAYGGTAEASKSLDAWIFHVDQANGSDYNSGLSRSDAFATIQEAVDAAVDGDTVMVWPGVYREEVDLKGRAITLQSADDAAVITTSTGFAFSFESAEGSNCILRNFIITGCYDSDGGAIFLNSATPTLTNLTITDNRFGISAYGVNVNNFNIVNCILWNNMDGDLYQCRARYSCVEQEDAVTRGIGNISTDPMFADSGNGDYHLKSKNGRYSPNDDAWVNDSEYSPCIDAGEPGDPGCEQKPHGSRVNMGAYGGTPFASKSRS